MRCDTLTNVGSTRWGKPTTRRRRRRQLKYQTTPLLVKGAVVPNLATSLPGVLAMPQNVIPVHALKRLSARGFNSYAAYLRSPEWDAVRWRYRHSRFPQCCAFCGVEDFELHHRSYQHVGGQERLYELVPLCREHHDQIHAVDDQNNQAVKSGQNHPLSRQKSRTRAA
jgi:hypothetical protein